MTPESQLKKSKAQQKTVEERAAERAARKAVCIHMLHFTQDQNRIHHMDVFVVKKITLYQNFSFLIFMKKADQGLMLPLIKFCGLL